MISWADFYLPPINLFSLPVQLMPEAECEHEYCMILHSFKQKWCYDCDAKMPSESHVPEHQR